MSILATIFCYGIKIADRGDPDSGENLNRWKNLYGRDKLTDNAL